MTTKMFFSRYRVHSHRRLAVLLALALSFTLSSPALAATDVYVVFASGSSQLKKEISASLEKVMKVKTYNVAMLVLADYSGKQKVIAKFSRADVVVILGEEPLQALSGSTFASHLIVVSAAGDDLMAGKTKVYAVPEGADISGIASNGTGIGVSTESALGSDMKTGDVFVIAPPLAMDRAIVELVKGLIAK